MPEKNRSTDPFNEMHLAVLPQAERQQLNQQLLLIRFAMSDFILYELKSQSKDVSRFVLPAKDTDVLWLCLQFRGKLSFNGVYVSQPGTLFSFAVGTGGYPVALVDGKQWALLLGLSGTSRQQLLAELAPLMEQREVAYTNWATGPITDVERRLLDAFSKCSPGPFTTPAHIVQLFANLHSAYVNHLPKQQEQDGEETLALLYDRAMGFIKRHAMEKDLSRDTIASACGCSTRKLHRAFEGRSLTLGSAIRVLRLYKARELLRTKPKLPIAEIARMLHFFDAKHLANHYKKQFHRSPSDERKAMGVYRK